MIEDASGIDTCSLTNTMIDYSQFKPRGYYEGEKKLEKYFRAMMWYGQIGFLQSEEDLDRSALLMTDYSQFKPRGYYEGEKKLEKYFRAMMWYGQIGFLQSEEDLDRSALLMTMAMEQKRIAYDNGYGRRGFGRVGKNLYGYFFLCRSQ